MRYLAIACLVVAFPVTADTNSNTRQENIASVSPTTVMSSHQTNINNDSFNRVGSVHCAAPTITGNIMGGEGPYQVMGQVGFAIPLGGSVCKSAMKSAAALISYQHHIEKVELERRGIRLDQTLRMERDGHRNAVFKMNAEKIRMCKSIHDSFSANPDTPLGSYIINACRGIEHLEVAKAGYPMNYPPGFERISPH